MERFLQKEQVLLGYNSRKSLGSPKIPFRNSSDVDFNDVFGGPPRHSSIQDWRHVGEGSRDSNFSKEEEREEQIHSSPWSGLSEKPVFGEESVNRRRYPSDDFFDDIFRGDESSGSTPRKLSRDPLSPSPGSRVQSPTRPVPHQSDPFGSSSLPSMLSLPTKLVKDIDYPPLPGPSRSPRKNNENTPNGLGFPSSPSALSSRFSNHGIQGQDGIRNDLRSLYRQSSLSKEFSSNSDGSSQVTISDKHDPEGHWKKNSRNEIVSDSSSQFHFSIYKWPSTGVPVAMPFRGGSNLSLTDKPENKTSTFHAPVLYETELPSLVDDMLLMDKPSQQLSENQDESSVIHIRKKRVDPSEVFEEVSHVKPESKSVTELGYTLKEVLRNLPSQVPEKEIKRSPNASSAAVDKGLSESTEKKFSSSKKEGQKPEHRPLYGLLKDDYDRQGNEKVIEQAKGKEGKVGKKTDSKKKAQKPETAPLYCMLDDSGRQGNCVIDPDRAKEGKAKGMHPIAGDVENSKKVKKQMGKRNLSTATEAIKSTLQWSPQDEKFVSNKVKGKVKDFVKIFNRESPSKFITNAGVPERSAAVNDNGEDRVETVNDSGPNRVEDQANISANNEDGKGKVTSMKKRTSDPSNDVDQVWKQSEKPQFVINTAAQKINSMSSGRDGNSVSCSETIPEGGRATINNEEESHYPDLDCTVKELSQDPNEPQSSQLHEDLQVWDAKIRKWANGKEGNIRSLLSTLQYVLWAESGWKPVPLVDIIEANPVKRAYQKALLCLHPDKLQQKGAAAHEKFIAEKVFDILQDAWTHFNTLGSF